MPGFIEDVRYGLRSFVKHKAVTALAIVSLALGIGANTTVFSLVSAVLMRSLPVRDIGSLVAVYTQDPKIPGLLPNSYYNVRDYAAQQQSPLSSIAVYFSIGLSMTGRGDPVPFTCQLASGNYFATLGLEPAVGRFFGPGDDTTPGAHPVAVLSHGFWTRHFGADPLVAGKTIPIGGAPYTIVGVAPKGFSGLNALVLADVWAPSMMYQRLLPNPGWFTSRRALIFSAVARLRPGAAIRQAESAVQGAAAELAQRFPKENQGRTVRMIPLAQATVGPNQRANLSSAGAVLMAIAGIVLLVACANVANLLLVRAAARSREIAIRVALGANRLRIARQLMIESLILSLAGAAGGLLLARWMRDYIWAARPPMLRSLDFQIPLDTRVLLFTVVLSLATGILFGLIPALRASRPDLVSDLKDRAGMAPPSGFLNPRSALVVMQVALAVVALTGAGLFLRSLTRAQHADLGFRADNLALLQVNLAAQGYDEARGREFLRQASERIAAAPGVMAVAVAGSAPFTGGFQRTVQLEGSGEDGQGRPTLASPVMPGYFGAMGIPLVRGRDFAAADVRGGPRVAIVNETMAARYWGGENPLGRRIRFFGEDAPYEVVGIARTATYLEIGEQPRPKVYTCMAQTYSPLVVLHARVSGNESGMGSVLRREARLLNPNLAADTSTMSRMISQALWAPRLAANLLGLFGALTLCLTAVGLHGLIAYTVQLRTRELGIRMAVGATPGEVVRMIVRDGIRLVALGVVIGSGLAIASGRIIRNLLFGVTPADAATFIGVPALLAVIAIGACWIPARRATRIDPLRALRCD